MSTYITPRRRHSSLFERMQNEIKKISRKLSAAKESYRQVKEQTDKNKKHFQSIHSLEDRHTTTIRKVRKDKNVQNSQKGSTTPIRRRFSNVGHTGHFSHHSNIHTGQIKNETVKLAPPSQEIPSNANRIIIKLQQENSKLWYRLGQTEELCKQQSYRIGYLKGQLKQANRRLQEKKEKEIKENIYLTTLMQHYKKKAQKYKQMISNDSEISECSV